MRNKDVIEAKELDFTVKGNITESELAEIDEEVRLLKEKREKEKSDGERIVQNLN